MQLQDKPLNGYSTATGQLSGGQRIRGKQSQSSIRATLGQAVQLKDLTFKVALELGSPFLNEAESDLARARAQAITGLVKSWSEAVNVIRIERGKPLPGSLRPESKPKKPKRSKAQVTLLDQDQPMSYQGVIPASTKPADTPVNIDPNSVRE